MPDNIPGSYLSTVGTVCLSLMQRDRLPSSQPVDRLEADAHWPAYEAIVHAQYARLCACAARYVGSGAAAEDIVQDVLLRVWNHRSRLGGVDLLGYLIQSIHNAAISTLRRERSDHARGKRLAIELSTGTSATRADAVEREEIARAVAEAIAELPDRCRLIFLLHRDGELTYREIAERLGLSIKTVETQMGRALRALRVRLAPFLCAFLYLLGPAVSRLSG